MSSDGRSFGLLVDLPREAAVAGAARHPSQPGLLALLLAVLRRWRAH
jgi:hypothetical protein